MNSNKQPIDTIREEISRQGQVRNKTFNGTVDLRLLAKENEFISHPLVFINCTFSGIHASFLSFDAPVELRACSINELLLQSCNFARSFTLNHCNLSGIVKFDCCGFSERNEITGNIFSEHVNFFDCQFKGHTRIFENDFKKDSNLLSNAGQPYANQFLGSKEIRDNNGILE